MTLPVAKTSARRGRFGRPALRQLVLVMGLLLLGGSLSGCIIEDHPGHGWCYWHPGACR